MKPEGLPTRPRLRHVEAFPIDHEGERLLALRDPAGYTPAVALLPMALLEVVSLFDGEHAIEDIQAAVFRVRGELVPSRAIATLAAQLDEQGFLEGSRFAARREAIDRAYLEATRRPAAHAGGAYAGEAEELRASIDGFFASAAGAGPIVWGPGATPRVRGLIAPHIDLHRGGPAYTWAYRDLAERGDADLFVVLGTCHAGMEHPFALTRKDFDTPFGPLPVDRDVVEAIAARARQDCFGSELAHRGEHSIEFQAVFLRYLYAKRRDVTIVPVLTSFAHEALARDVGPETDPRVPRFLDALADALAASGRRAVVIAGADLAHVGPRFGDPEPVSAAGLTHLDGEDRAMLETVAAGDASAFFENAARDGDRRRICGLSPIYALLRTLDGAQGVLRRYAQWPDPQAVVTFASVVF